MRLAREHGIERRTCHYALDVRESGSFQQLTVLIERPFASLGADQHVQRLHVGAYIAWAQQLFGHQQPAA